MKTFKLIGMALLAVVMCVNFASCSSDDDEEGKSDNPFTGGGKKLSSVVVKTDYSYSDNVINFTYNSDGYLIRAKDKWKTYTYSWSENTITIVSSEQETAMITLNNSKIKSYEDDDEIILFFYDSNNYLSSTNCNGKEYDFTWDAGNLIEVDETKQTFDKSMKSTSVMAIIEDYDNPYEDAIGGWGMQLLLAAHPNLFGTFSKNALSTLKVYDAGLVGGYYSYKYDKEEYPNTITETNIDDNTLHATYEITWE